MYFSCYKNIINVFKVFLFAGILQGSKTVGRPYCLAEVACWIKTRKSEYFRDYTNHRVPFRRVRVCVWLYTRRIRNHFRLRKVTMVFFLLFFFFFIFFFFFKYIFHYIIHIKPVKKKRNIYFFKL